MSESLTSNPRFPDPEKDLFSDAMDAAASVFHSVRHGILRNAERAGETTDGEVVVRRSIAAAFNAYVRELRLADEPTDALTLEQLTAAIAYMGCDTDREYTPEAFARDLFAAARQSSTKSEEPEPEPEHVCDGGWACHFHDVKKAADETSVTQENKR